MEWRPHQGPQEYALQTTAYETLYGGARGGGKTDAGQVWMVKPNIITNPRFRGLVIRKNAKDLSDWVDRARFMYSGLGVQIAYHPPILTFPWGSIIRTGHLRDENAYTQYQGHEYQRMLIEELNQIPFERNYLQLLGSCRSTIPGIDARIFCTTNPGGLGHAWVKGRFVDPAPPGKKFVDKSSGRTRIFIPAKLEDNPALMAADPQYMNFLDGLKDSDPELYKAWRLGDWDTFAGQYFRTFDRRVHVIPRYGLETNNGFLIGNLDWGRKDNFAFYVKHVYPVKYNGATFWRVVTFIEVYGQDRDPDDWAQVIIDRLAAYSLKLTDLGSIMADNQIFGITPLDKGITIADMFYKVSEEYRGLLRPASKNRIAGWQNMQQWLAMAPDGLPYYQIAENCTNLIRTLPMAVHDENKVEDIDQKGEDDALDSERYGFSELKFIDYNVGTQEYGRIEQERTSITEDLNIFDEDEPEQFKQLI